MWAHELTFGLTVGAICGTCFGYLLFSIFRQQESDWPGFGEEMVEDFIQYLRELAQTCTRLARACPDLATSRGLEEVAVDLMAKARELEQLRL
jgi:hypothetical protein